MNAQVSKWCKEKPPSCQMMPPSCKIKTPSCKIYTPSSKMKQSHCQINPPSCTMMPPVSHKSVHVHKSARIVTSKKSILSILSNNWNYRDHVKYMFIHTMLNNYIQLNWIYIYNGLYIIMLYIQIRSCLWKLLWSIVCMYLFWSFNTWREYI